MNGRKVMVTGLLSPVARVARSLRSLPPLASGSFRNEVEEETERVDVGSDKERTQREQPR